MRKKKKKQHQHKPMFQLGQRVEFDVRERLGPKGSMGLAPHLQTIPSIGWMAPVTEMKFENGRWKYLLGGKNSGEHKAGWFDEVMLMPVSLPEGWGKTRDLDEAIGAAH